MGEAASALDRRSQVGVASRVGFGRDGGWWRCAWSRPATRWIENTSSRRSRRSRSWQSIAQIDARYGRHERDAILAATTAQLFLPPLGDPTTTEYVTGLLGKEPVGHSNHGHGLASQETVAVSEQNIADTARLRQVQSERALLVYRDLPPAILQAPRWYRDPRFAAYRSNLHPPLLRSM